MALTDDALDEYYSHVKDKEEYDHINDPSALIRIFSKRRETPDFYMMIKNKWSETKLCDVRRAGETLQKTFERLKRYAIRLQKTSGPEYQPMQCCATFSDARCKTNHSGDG